MAGTKADDAGDGNGGRPNGAMTTAQQPAQTQPDVDEFGLPIKKYVAPVEETSENDDSATKSTEAPNKDHVEVTSDATQAAPEQEMKQPSSAPSTETPKVVESNADSDTDDAEFKDAQSEIEPESASVSPEKRGEGEKINHDGSKDNKDTTTGPTTPATNNISVVAVTPSPGATTPKPDNSTDHGAEAPKEPSMPKPDKNNQTTQDESAPKEPAEKPRESQEIHAEDSAAHPKVAHSRNTSTLSNGIGVSEFSHQQMSMAPEAVEDDKDDEWQEMPSFARYDMYNDDDKLVAREMKEDDLETYGYAGLGGAGKGYTRVQLDEDAQSATSLDENTQYLFKDVNGTDMNDDDARDAVSQMQATKDLLTEGQRIAYVGIARLEIAKFTKESEELEAPKKMKKMVNTSSENTKMWGQKMMMRLYAHMEISEQEQVMIEQLADHGVQPADLTPVLMTNARVHNPMANQNQRSSASPSPDPEDEPPADVPPPYEATTDNHEVPEVTTPSHMPDTAKIDIDLRWTVLCDLFLVLIADSIYDSRSRILLERVAKTIDISWLEVCRFEKRVTDALEMQQAAEKEDWNEDQHMEARRKEALKRRYVMMLSLIHI